MQLLPLFYVANMLKFFLSFLALYSDVFKDCLGVVYLVTCTFSVDSPIQSLLGFGIEVKYFKAVNLYYFTFSLICRQNNCNYRKLWIQDIFPSETVDGKFNQNRLSYLHTHENLQITEINLRIDLSRLLNVKAAIDES